MLKIQFGAPKAKDNVKYDPSKLNGTNYFFGPVNLVQ
jgi:hypothetical protein